MVELSIRKRQRKNGTVYEYRFEIATVDGKRKWETKCGFKTKADALKAGNAALSHYEKMNTKQYIALLLINNILIFKRCNNRLDKI